MEYFIVKWDLILANAILCRYFQASLNGSLMITTPLGSKHVATIKSTRVLCVIGLYFVGCSISRKRDGMWNFKITKCNFYFNIQSCPPYPLIQYPRFQLSAVNRGPKKIGKSKKQTAHKFQNARQARMGHNMVKSSSPNAPSTWPIILCPRTYVTSESLTFIRKRDRERENTL
jgi:hypothetical protein